MPSSITYELAPCPVCGTMDGVELATAEQIRDEVEALWRFHTKRLRPDTPPERLADRLAFSQRPPIRLERCRSCGTVHRNPRERPRELAAAYERDAPTPETLRALHDTQRRSYRVQARRLRRVLGRGGSVIEVGSYVGAFLAAASAAGFDVSGVDVNEQATDFARQLGFPVTLGELHDVDPGRRFDAVAIWNCFDQLPDPRAAATAARDRLEPGGVLAIRVPNGGFYSSLRRRDGWLAPAARAILAHNNLLSFPYRFGFTPSSLATLVERLGFRVVRTVGDVLVPTADVWTRTAAAAEEWSLKTALRGFARLADLTPARGTAATRMPWFELYARVE